MAHPLTCLGQLLSSSSFGCSDEALTIAAMTAVQSPFLLGGDASSAASGEIERRKFTAEEGDHLTLLNAYEAFVRHGRKTAKWSHAHRLDFKALSRAVSIRGQLAKYLARFSVPIISCGGDALKIRRCICSSYFRNAAKMSLDGTYRSVREDVVSPILFRARGELNADPDPDTPRAPLVCAVHAQASDWLGRFPRSR